MRGHQVPQGGLRPGRGRVYYQNNEAIRRWRGEIIEAVVKNYGERQLSLQPVALVVVLMMTRPNSHFDRDGALKVGTPYAKITTPDIDKLCANVFNALTGVVYHDDAQVWRLSASKVYTAKEPVSVIGWIVGEPSLCARERLAQLEETILWSHIL